MPAGITETDGMAYVGRRPWHGLGTYVEGAAMTAAQAIEAAAGIVLDELPMTPERVIGALEAE